MGRIALTIYVRTLALVWLARSGVLGVLVIYDAAGWIATLTQASRLRAHYWAAAIGGPA